MALQNAFLRSRGGHAFFDVLALKAIFKLQHFNSQDLSNMVWAYANVRASKSTLFKAAGDSVVTLENLKGFKPQEISNILWVYALAEESHPWLCKKFTDHIVALHDFRDYGSQALSNILWAYATASILHPRLFKRLSDHVVAMKDLSWFKPQEISNITWAYATAGDKSQPPLFMKIAAHIVSLDDLSGFKPQHISNITWAYATAGQSHPPLFKKLVDVAINRCKDFNSQAVTNIFWAFATVGQADQHSFSSCAPTVKSILDECNSQGIANIGRAYAVANVSIPSLFNANFVIICLEKEHDFGMKDLHQLHQWQLWQEELKSDIRLPLLLREKCQKAFSSLPPSQSKLQDDVVSELFSIGLHPEEEVLTKSGYRFNALSVMHGKKIGIEVDGPFHFVGSKPNGCTLLKHRQVNTLDETPVISVPYW
ncbi:hypothetical protein ACHAW5_008122 [Stephanodiscus triporus]|uniref:RNA-editing substrate-binding complex 6 protein domain-containing protein n=1 Tax=Stephanodiscus triporus TaxID=2934178 RepID=A0ABD3NIG8_9STRA